MQRCITSRCVYATPLHRGVARRHPLLLSRSITAKSGSAPESSSVAKEAATAQQQEERQPAADPAVSVAAERASTSSAEGTQASKAACEEEPSSTSSVDDEKAEATAATPRTPLTAHPLGDVPEEVEEDLFASKELVAEVLDGSAFGKRGEQWLLAQVAAIGMLLFPPLTLKGLVDFAATLALTSGFVFIVTAFFNLGRSLSPLPEPRKKHQLVVSGIYGYVRHPMYGGVLLAGFGLAVLTRNETRLAILVLLWWALENKVAMEEKALSARYPEYTEYKAKVKKFLPFLY